VASALPDPSDKPLLAVLRGERRDPPPMWLMRQAGRYLPEYRELRAARGGFLDMAYDPATAAEITLQPHGAEVGQHGGPARGQRQ